MPDAEPPAPSTSATDANRPRLPPAGSLDRGGAPLFTVPEGRLAPNPTPDVLLQMIQQNDDKHEDAHARLRDDIRECERRIGAAEAIRASDFARFAKADDPIDIDKLRFNWRIVTAIAAVCLASAAAVWAANAGNREILVRIEASQNLNDERLGAVREAIALMQKRQEAQQYEIQGLKEMLMKGTR